MAGGRIVQSPAANWAVGLMSLYAGLFLLGLAATGLYLTRKTAVDLSGALGRARLASDAVPVSPAEASPGDTDVVGRAVAESPAGLPIGDDECVATYLHVFVGEYEDKFPVDEETRTVPFRLEADGGAVAVDHEDVTLETTTDTQYKGSWYLIVGSLPDEVVEFFERAGLPVPTKPKVAVDQRHVPTGGTAWVHGEVERRDGELVVTGNDGEVVVSDAPPDEFALHRSCRVRSAGFDVGAYAVGTVVCLTAGVVLVLA